MEKKTKKLLVYDLIFKSILNWLIPNLLPNSIAFLSVNSVTWFEKKNVFIIFSSCQKHQSNLKWQVKTWNPTIYNLIHWFPWSMGQTTRCPSFRRSKYFLFIISYRSRALKTLYFHFYNSIRKISKWMERVFAKNSGRFYEKKQIILGTSNTCLTSCLSHRPSRVDWQIFLIYFFRHRYNLA